MARIPDAGHSSYPHTYTQESATKQSGYDADRQMKAKREQKKKCVCAASLSGIHRLQSKNMADLSIELGIEEIIFRIGLAEWVLGEESSCRWSVGCVPEK